MLVVRAKTPAAEIPQRGPAVGVERSAGEADMSVFPSVDSARGGARDGARDRAIPGSSRGVAVNEIAGGILGGAEARRDHAVDQVSLLTKPADPAGAARFLRSPATYDA